LLKATRLAARPRRLSKLDVVSLVLALSLVAAIVAAGLSHKFSALLTAVLAICGGSLVLGPYFWWRQAPPRPGSIAQVDASKLQRLVIAEALLANEREGLVALTEAAEGLRADPLKADMLWPPGAVEASLLRGRSMRVSQLVADWRSGTGSPLSAITQAALRRGVFQEVGTRHGAALEATALSQAAMARGLPASLVETCPAERPKLWRSLTAAIEDGFLLSPATTEAPRQVADPRADAGVDSFAVPSNPLPEQALTTAVLVVATIIVGAIALVRLTGAGPGLSSANGWWAWPHCLGVGAAVWIFFAARRTWPEEPLPPYGSPGEEEALADRRRRRLARPPARPPLLIRLPSSAVFGVLVFVLTAVVTPAGIAVLALAFGFVSWRARKWYRLQLLMPSAREVELAVARRSRELSAGYPSTATKVPEGAAAVKGGEKAPRARRWLAAGDLPAPTTAAVTWTDRRRRLAAAAIRRHFIALLLFVSGLAAVSGGLAWTSRTDPQLITLFCVAWLLCLSAVPGRLLHAIHQTRSAQWKVARGATGGLLRAFAAVLPHTGTSRLAEAGRALRRCIAEEPDFWRNETLDLAAPLGASPRILSVVTAVLSLHLLISGLIGGSRDLGIAGAAMLGLTAAYMVFLRRHGTAGMDSRQPGLRLVLLRVFGSPSFDDLLELVRPWLLCGPVAHLEGYDSVARSAEIREALALGQIDRILVHSPEDLSRRLAALPAFPDDNGRYQRQAFQCTDVIWRSAIRALLGRCDAVLMDLSDLGPEDMGCAYELGLLLDQVPLSRVLLLINARTDLDCLWGVLDEAEQRIAQDSPNGYNPASAWRLLRIGGSTARDAEEHHHEWLRRLDTRPAPLALVHFMLDGVADGNWPEQPRQS